MGTDEARAESLSGTVLGWRPKGMRDFVEVAGRLAAVVGNVPGLRSVEVHRMPSGVRVYLIAANIACVRQAAAQHGWRVWEREDEYALAAGSVAGMSVNLTWATPTNPVTAPGVAS